MNPEREAPAQGPRQIFEDVYSTSLRDGRPRHLISFVRSSVQNGTFSIADGVPAGKAPHFSEFVIAADFDSFIRGYVGAAINFETLSGFLHKHLERKIKATPQPEIAEVKVERTWKMVNPKVKLKVEITFEKRGQEHGEIETWSLIPSLSFRIARKLNF